MMDRRIRHRELAGLPNLTDQQIADKEAENGLLQFDLMFEWIEQAIADGKAPLSPQRLREFQRLAVVGLEPTAGEYREEPVFIDGTVHVPPPWEDVPGRVDDMCAYVSSTQIVIDYGVGAPQRERWPFSAIKARNLVTAPETSAWSSSSCPARRNSATRTAPTPSISVKSRRSTSRARAASG